MKTNRSTATADASSTSLAGKTLVAYYGGTVLFMALDYGLGFNLRLTFLDDAAGWRFIYYLVLIGCFLLMWRYPQWTAYIAAGESLLTLSLIILDTAMRVVIVTDDMIEHGRGFVSTRELVNFMISGTVMYLSYVRNLQSINRG